MALVLRTSYNAYSEIFNEKTEITVMPFMSSPVYPILLVVAYLRFVLKLGPQLMKDRPAFKLRKVLIVYNLAQVLANGLYFILGLPIIARLNWHCAPLDYGNTPENRQMKIYCYIFLVLKVVDLLDTLFFILRKKNSQVTFLHMYHHAFMVIFCWTACRFWSSGQGVYLCPANSLVHTVMYFYYFLTIYKPEYRKSVALKKLVTIVQLIQFLFFLVTYGQLLFKPDCDFPKIVVYIVLPQTVFMIIMFSDFYYKTYHAKKPRLIRN